MEINRKPEPIPDPIEGELLGDYRKRVGLPGEDTAAARSMRWSVGGWWLGQRLNEKSPREVALGAFLLWLVEPGRWAYHERTASFVMANLDAFAAEFAIDGNVTAAVNRIPR